MTWENFEKDAFKITENEYSVITRKVLSNYQQAQKSLEALLKEQYLRFLSGVKPDDYYNEMIKRDRLQNLLKQVRAEYFKYSSKNYFEITNAIKIAFSNTYYRKYFAANWLTEKNVFGLFPRQLSELAILGTDEAWKNITADIIKRYGDKSLYMPQGGTLANLLKNDRTVELNKIQELITRRFIDGQSYTNTINGVRDVIGRQFTDGKVTRYTGAKANALRIIITETNRVANLGNYAMSKDLSNKGYNIKRRLISTLDNRTRRQSAAMDGQTVKINEHFTYPNGTKAMVPGTTGVAKYDINDRETVINIINNVEPTARIGRNPVTGKNEYFSYKDFDSWAKDNNLAKNVYGEYIRRG